MNIVNDNKIKNIVLKNNTYEIQTKSDDILRKYDASRKIATEPKKKKFIPLLFFIILGVIAMIIQMIFPTILLLLYSESLITSIMFFIIFSSFSIIFSPFESY